jgi:hypothetical protein
MTAPLAPSSAPPSVEEITINERPIERAAGIPVAGNADEAKLDAPAVADGDGAVTDRRDGDGGSSAERVGARVRAARETARATEAPAGEGRTREVDRDPVIIGDAPPSAEPVFIAVPLEEYVEIKRLLILRQSPPAPIGFEKFAIVGAMMLLIVVILAARIRYLQNAKGADALATLSAKELRSAARRKEREES